MGKVKQFVTKLEDARRICEDIQNDMPQIFFETGGVDRASMKYYGGKLSECIGTMNEIERALEILGKTNEPVNDELNEGTTY